MSKFTLTVIVFLIGSYDDGAGNTCTYEYDFTTRTTTHYMSDVWKLNFLDVKLPAVAISTLVSVNTASVVGAPPAANTRDIDVSTAGKVTFKDASETLSHIVIKVTVATMGDHPYTIWDAIGLIGESGRWANVSVSTAAATTGLVASPAADVVLEDITDFGQVAQYIKATFYPTVTDAAAGQIKPFGIAFAEGELMSREYKGAYIELALKGAITLMRARKGLSPLTYGLLEVVDYLQGDGPLDHFTPYKQTSILLAA